MYNSPVEVIVSEMQTEIENNVVKTIQSYGIEVSKDELLKALANDRYQYDKGYKDGFNDAIDKFRKLIRDVAYI